MREIRTSGSEGGGAGKLNQPSLPLSCLGSFGARVVANERSCLHLSGSVRGTKAEQGRKGRQGQQGQ